MASSSSGHQHSWRNEPPEGKAYFNKSYDEREGDEEEMATNRMLTSPEELNRLRCLLAKDPAFKTSPSWPMLTEWCATCTTTRLVRVELLEEVIEVKLERSPEARDFRHVANNNLEGNEHIAFKKVEGCKQMPGKKVRRRRGGRETYFILVTFFTQPQFEA